MSAWDAVRCVVFDFDGTLVDSNAIKRGAYFEILAETPGSAEVVEAVLQAAPAADRHGVLAAVHRVLSDRGAEPLAPASALVGRYSRLCEDRVAACSPLPGVLETLAALHATHALYLASATPTDALERVVARRGWRPFFRGVLGGPASKLDNLGSIAQGEGLAAGEMVYVGDGAVDRTAAVAFGCRFLGFGAPALDLPEGSPLAVLVAGIVARSAGQGAS